MWNIPSPERLQNIPRLYETEKTQLKDKRVYLHFFIGGSDWYICEYDGEDLFWGFCILNGDYQNAEWGYVSFSEMKAIRIDGCFEVDCVLEEYWKIQKASEIKKISMIHGWEMELQNEVTM